MCASLLRELTTNTIIFQAGMLLAVPPLVVMLTKSSIIENYDVSSVETIYCGGASLALSVMTEVKKR